MHTSYNTRSPGLGLGTGLLQVYVFGRLLLQMTDHLHYTLWLLVLFSLSFFSEGNFHFNLEGSSLLLPLDDPQGVQLNVP